MTAAAVSKAGGVCGAKTRAGTPCRQKAGWGTDHVGQGRCKLHGGKKPTRHGRYSTIRHESVRELAEKMAAEADPLDTRPELALLRALLHDWIDRYHELTDALFAWNQAEYRQAEEEGRKARPKQIPEIQDVRPLLAEISKIVARIEKARAQNAISRPELMRLMQEMARVVEHHVHDENTLQAIKEGWLEIRLA